MKHFFLCLICLSLVACASAKKYTNNFFGGEEDNSEKPAELTEIQQQLKLNELWSDNIGSGSDKKYLKLSPEFDDDKIFVADNEGELAALDAISGKTIWRQDVDVAITGGPGAGDNLVMIGTQEGEVLVFDETNGDKLWRARVSSEILAAPQTEDDIVVIRTIDGKIFGLKAANGERLWVYDKTVPALTLRGTSAPVIDSGLVVAGFDGGRLTALELETGKLFWETRIAQGSGRSEMDRMVDIDAEPIIDAGTVYVATFQGNVAAVELETGRIAWIREIPSHAGVGLNADYVFVSDDNSHIWALDRWSGTSVWKQDKLQARAATAPASIGNYVVVGDIEGYLHWMDANTGDFIARTRISQDRIIAAPIVSNNILYTHGSNGVMSAVSYGDRELEVTASAAEETNGSFNADATFKDVEDNYDDEEGIPLEELMDIFESDDQSVN